LLAGFSEELADLAFWLFEEMFGGAGFADASHEEGLLGVSGTVFAIFTLSDE